MSVENRALQQDDVGEGESSALDVEDVWVDETDLYQVLGVASDATEKQINTAFKRLSLKYHPDRQTDDVSSAHAQQRLHAINEAYNVLCDRVKRAEYDNERAHAKPTPAFDRAEESEESSAAAGDGSRLTANLSRVFGAVINKLGLPFAGSVASDIVHTAEEICRNGGIEGGGPPLDTRVTDLPWGWAMESKVDRSACAFFRLTVDETHAQRGFLVHVRSPNRGKFRVLLFDHTGRLLHQEECFKEKERSYSQATLFCTQFPTYRLSDAPQDSASKSLPPLFHRLDSFVCNQLSIEAGQFLVCVLGENMLGKTQFSMVVVPAKAELPEAAALQSVDEQLLHMQRGLEGIKNDYLQAKAAFDDILARMKTEEEKLDDLLQDREKQYTGLLNNVINAFNPLDVTSHSPAEMNSHSADTEARPIQESDADAMTSGSSAAHVAQHLLGLWGSATSTATTVGSNAAQSASAAGGWFARRLSNTVVQLQSMVQQPQQQSSTHDESETASHPPQNTVAVETVAPVDSNVSAAAVAAEQPQPLAQKTAADPSIGDESSPHKTREQDLEFVDESI